MLLESIIIIHVLLYVVNYVWKRSEFLVLYKKKTR